MNLWMLPVYNVWWMCSFGKRMSVGYAFNQFLVELYTVKSISILFPWSSASETYITI